MDDSFDPTFLTADVDVDFDFLLTQSRHKDDNYWISDEQAEEMTSDGGEFPNANDWKDDAPEVIYKTEKYLLIRLDSTYENKQRQK
jgi:hypothetical protein